MKQTDLIPADDSMRGKFFDELGQEVLIGDFVMLPGDDHFNYAMVTEFKFTPKQTKIILKNEWQEFGKFFSRFVIVRRIDGQCLIPLPQEKVDLHKKLLKKLK